MEYRHGRRAVLALTAAPFLGACGGGSSSGSGSETTIETWSDYCIATFTQDYVVKDSFDDVVFTAGTGEEYVISSLDGGAAELVFLAPTGPKTFPVEMSPFPFTHDCEGVTTTEYMAVFSDVTVYADEELTTPICELSAGHAVARDTTSGAGHAVTNSGSGSSLTYEVILNSLSADCGGANLGYVSVPQTTVFGTTTWLVPIDIILGPA